MTFDEAEALLSACERRIGDPGECEYAWYNCETLVAVSFPTLTKYVVVIGNIHDADGDFAGDARFESEHDVDRSTPGGMVAYKLRDSYRKT